jgi:hypothetical protein
MAASRSPEHEIEGRCLASAWFARRKKDWQNSKEKPCDNLYFESTRPGADENTVASKRAF